jgi:hypothetical protein
VTEAGLFGRALSIQLIARTGSLHGPVSFPHICVRTDDASPRTVYLIIRNWDGKCASPLSRAISEWKPRPSPVPPDAGRGFSLQRAQAQIPSKTSTRLPPCHAKGEVAYAHLLQVRRGAKRPERCVGGSPFDEIIVNR